MNVRPVTIDSVVYNDRVWLFPIILMVFEIEMKMSALHRSFFI